MEVAGGHAFLDSARRHWHRTALCDGTGASLTYGQALVRSAVLGRFLAQSLGDDSYVGILLPPTVPAAVVNLALVLQGKIPVNLNYTAGQNMIDSAIDQCAIRHVITSPKVLDKFQIKPKASLLMLEDVARSIPRTGKLAGAGLAHLLRFGVLERLFPGLACLHHDSVATVIFTTGSTGDPKGVVLSHRNILCNVTARSRHLDLLPEE